MIYTRKISKAILAVFLTTLVMTAVTGAVVRAQSPDKMEDARNYLDSGRQNPAPGQLSTAATGDVVNSFPNPSALRGLTFREDRLWGITSSGEGGTGPGVLYEMDADSGAVLSTITISPRPSGTFGLGFDTLRDVFVVTTLDTILKVDPTTGAVIDSFPAPGPGPIGAAYDPVRDGYWISDCRTDRIYLVNPYTGVETTSLPVPPGASLIAGTGYDPKNDVIIFNSRTTGPEDIGKTYLIRANDGVLVAVFSTPRFSTTPPSPYEEVGQGAAIRPTDLTGYLTHFREATIFVVELPNVIVTDTGHEVAPFITDDDCTLGEAIVAANTDTAIDACPAGSGADIIGLGVGETYTLTAVDNTTDGANGLPSITSEITIDGSGATIERDDAAPDFRIFHVAYGGDLTLNQLTLSNGRGEYGGGIQNVDSGTVELINSTVSGNKADVGGGGIHNFLGTVTLTNSTVNGNNAEFGGGILNCSAAGPSNSTVSSNNASIPDTLVTLTNSTISGNNASRIGGGIFNCIGNLVYLFNSTVSGNSTDGHGGGIHNGYGTAELTNTMVAKQVSGEDCSGPITSNGHNLDSDGNCSLDAPGDLTADPKLGPLQNNGGRTETHALLPGSPAIDKGNDIYCPSTDQRGVPREDGDGNGTKTCDIGTYEAPNAIRVTTTRVSPEPDDDCSLIEAINEAQMPGSSNGDCNTGSLRPDTIILQTRRFYTLTTVDNTFFNSGLPPITSQIIINGNESIIKRSVDAGTPAFRIFVVTSGGDLTIYRTTVVNGLASGSSLIEKYGGGIFNFGTVKLTNSAVSDSKADHGGGGIANLGGTVTLDNNSTVAFNESINGGGIYNSEGGLVRLDKSTVSRNRKGGGIWNGGAGSLVKLDKSTVSGNNDGGIYNNDDGRLTNSTISGNNSDFSGGGIFNRGTLELTNCTVSDNNTSASGGGIFNFSGGTVKLTNTILADQRSGEDCSGAITSLGYNLDSDGYCTNPDDDTDITNPNPGLDSLANNGGLTETHALQRSSPAIDKGNNDVCEAPPINGLDQRGFLRIAPCDIGAYEFDAITAITLLSFTAQASADHVTLAWETGTEMDNAGFNLWRAVAADGPYTQLNDTLIPAEGDAVSGASYVYTDTDVVKGVTYYYQLEDVDIHGVSTFHGPVSATPASIRRIYLPLILAGDQSW